MPYLKKPKKQPVISFKEEERKKIYCTTRWRNLRKAHLLKHPLCELCEKQGKIVPAIDVHHIISFMTTNDPLKRLKLAFDPDNLMSVCKECHQKLHIH